MRVFLQIIGEGEYKGFLISLTTGGVNLIHGRGYYKVKGVNKKGSWLKRIEWKGPLTPPIYPTQAVILRTEEIEGMEKLERLLEEKI